MKATLIMERAKNIIYFFDADQQFITNFAEKQNMCVTDITFAQLAKQIVVILAKFVEFSQLTQDDLQSVETTDGEIWRVLASGCFVYLAIDSNRSRQGSVFSPPPPPSYKFLHFFIALHAKNNKC